MFSSDDAALPSLADGGSARSWEQSARQASRRLEIQLAAEGFRVEKQTGAMGTTEFVLKPGRRKHRAAQAQNEDPGQAAVPQRA